jgi:membrane protease YdiL (CAAX protease family)
MENKKNVYKKITLFLILTFAFSLIFYYLIISLGSMEGVGAVYTLGMMWCPGLAALLTQFFFQRNLRDLGWRLGKIKYLLLSYLIPFLYCLTIYTIVWATGLGGFPNQEFIYMILKEFGLNVQSSFLAFVGLVILYCILITIVGGFFVLGEEIGWRGFLIPYLAKVTTFSKTAIISGIIWALWHYPLFFFGIYNSGSPYWYGITLTTISIVGMSFVLVWLRLKSGSLWTAVMLHTSHNLFMQEIFTPLTIDTGITKYIIDEFGIGLTIVALILAYLFWRKSSELPSSILQTEHIVQ